MANKLNIMENTKFDLKKQDFIYDEKIVDDINAPLSLTVQLTRRCNLRCKWCSEAELVPDSSTKDLKFLADQMKGVGRIYISGGEPTLRKDFKEIVDYYSKRFPVVALLTNATLINKELARFLKGKIQYAKVGIDGPRLINNYSRGNYDLAIEGIKNLREVGIDVSISAVFLRSIMPYFDLLIQTADVIDISSIKFIEPVRRGRGHKCNNNDMPTKKEIEEKIEELKEQKNIVGWKPTIEYTFWDDKTKGYSLLVYPNFEVHLWPILDSQENTNDTTIMVGNLKEENILDIWKKLPIEFKQSHILKYTGTSMRKI